MRAASIATIAAWGMACVAVAATDEPSQMRSAANGFYGVYQTFHPSDGIPSATDRAKYAPFLSPTLEQLLGKAEAAEARFGKANKDSPPLLEGDIFTSMFEGASTVAVGECSGDAAKGRCVVNLEYVEKGAKPIAWTDAILLVNTPAGWRIDDIAYGGRWAFGNKGRLSELLKQTIDLQ